MYQKTLFQLYQVHQCSMNVLELNDESNLQHAIFLASDEKGSMVLKTVQSSREHKPVHEDFINIVPNTPVDIMIVDNGSVETQL